MSTSPQNVIDAVVNVESRVADFIANGPDDGLGGYVRDRYRDRCNEYANAPLWARVLANGPTGSLNRLCTPYFNQQGADGPTNEIPFTGGQCPVNYNVFRTITNGSTGVRNPETNLGVFRGPFELRTNPNPDDTCPAAGGTLTNEILFAVGSNATVSAINSCTAFPIAPAYRFTRTDGQPDNCGNPDPVLRPGPNPPDYPGPQPGPEPTADPTNPDGPPLLPIPPYNDPVGGPTPVVAPEPAAPAVDVPGNPDTSPGSPDAISPPIAVDPGPDGGGDTTNFGEPPAGRAWIGCLLVFDFPPFFGGIAGSEVANLASPRVFGNASLVYEGGRGNAEKVTSEHWQLFRPSGALGVTGVFVNVDPGFSYTVRPVSIELCPENNCGAAE